MVPQMTLHHAMSLVEKANKKDFYWIHLFPVQIFYFLQK